MRQLLLKGRRDDFGGEAERVEDLDPAGRGGGQHDSLVGEFVEERKLEGVREHGITASGASGSRAGFGGAHHLVRTEKRAPRARGREEQTLRGTPSLPSLLVQVAIKAQRLAAAPLDLQVRLSLSPPQPTAMDLGTPCRRPPTPGRSRAR